MPKPHESGNVGGLHNYPVSGGDASSIEGGAGRSENNGPSRGNRNRSEYGMSRK